MTDPNIKSDSDSTDGSESTKRPSSKLGCVIKTVIVLALIVAALVAAQTILAPEVEDDSTVQIQKGPAAAAASDVADGNDANAETLNRPNSPDKPKRLTDTVTMKAIKAADHPLDPLMALADQGLEIIDSKYFDYSAKMLSQVRTGGKLHAENLMQLKIRHDGTTEIDGKKTAIPFSVYSRFLKPKSKVGQEAIWVRGKNDGKILGHGTGLMGFKTIPLDPEGAFAMTGNRYPIFQIGFRNLIVKMKEFGTNDRKYGECDVQIERNVLVDNRSCTLITVTHPEKREHFEYHIAKIYIDDEYEVITGYEGYLWPEKSGEEPPLLEKYFYTDLKLNPGLKDIDFDIANEEYDYPRW